MSEPPPSDVAVLRDFPYRESMIAVWRIHRNDQSPAYFSTRGLWRFDPPPSARADFGTCYSGFRPEAAFLETLDISAGRDYKTSQEWAAALFATGFDGLLYIARHDPQLEFEAIALFATGGGIREDLFEPVKTTGPIPEALLAKMQAEFGFVVIPKTPLI